LQVASAVAEAIELCSQSLRQGEVQVAHGRGIGRLQMLSGMEHSAAAARQHQRQIAVQVLLAFADTAAIEHHGGIQERAFSFANRPQPIEEPGQLFDIVTVDAGDLFEVRGIAAMVGKLMMRLGDADFGTER
jgi:hypothetical protein